MNIHVAALRPDTACYDPIVTVIERHCDLTARYGALVWQQHFLESVLPESARRWNSSVDDREPSADCDDDDDWMRLQFFMMDVGDELARVNVQLVTTIPTTVAGLDTLISYIEEQERCGHCLICHRFTGEYDQATGEPQFIDMNDALKRLVKDATRKLAETLREAT